MERPPDLGRRLRAAREYAGLSQAAFAEEMGGISQSSVVRYEKGELPDDRKLRHLLHDWAKICQVPADWFTAPWSNVGTTTDTAATDGAMLGPAEPEWVGRLEDQMSFVLAVIRKVHSEAAAEVISEGLGDDAPAPARPESESTAMPAPRRSRRRG